MSDLHHTRTTPTVRAALAQNYADLRAAKFDLTRARDRHHRAAPELIAAAWTDVLDTGSRVAELEVQRDRLLAALTAHELTWAHLYEDCPICTGAVRINEDRPF